MDQGSQKQRAPNRDRYDFEGRWPDNVWSIGVNRIDLLGVDEEGSLYWNGKPIEMKRPLTLTVWQRVGAVAVALSAVVAAASAAVSAYADMAKP